MLRCASLNASAAAAALCIFSVPALAASLSTSNITSGGATVTISGHSGKWSYTLFKSSDLANAVPGYNCVATGISGSTLTLTGLDADTSYRVDAAVFDYCGGSGYLTNVSFTTAAGATNPALTISNLTGSLITTPSATLTIANHTDAWYYKYTVPQGGTCSSEVASGTSTKNVTGLAGNTSYTFKAYSDSTCSTELAAAANAFLTRPAKPTSFTVTAGTARVELTAQITGTGVLSKWQYRQKASTDNDTSALGKTSAPPPPRSPTG